MDWLRISRTFSVWGAAVSFVLGVFLGGVIAAELGSGMRRSPRGTLGRGERRLTLASTPPTVQLARGATALFQILDAEDGSVTAVVWIGE